MPRKIPLFKLLAIAEVAMLAREHAQLLEPRERHRLVQLVRASHGRPRSLSASERDELRRLVAKAEPRLFVTAAADKFSPVPLPKRMRRRR